MTDINLLLLLLSISSGGSSPENRGARPHGELGRVQEQSPWLGVKGVKPPEAEALLVFGR